MDYSFCDTIAAGFSQSIRLMLFGSTEQTVCLSLLHMHTHSNVWFLEVQTMNYQMIYGKRTFPDIPMWHSTNDYILYK